MAAKPPRIPRPPGELANRLRGQFGYLVRSAMAFDEGVEDEAPRLAGACRVLFIPGSGKSLVYQLGAHKSITLPDTSIRNQQAVAPGVAIQLYGTDAQGKPLTAPRTALGGLAAPAADLRGTRWVAQGDAWMLSARWVPLQTWLMAPAVRSSSNKDYSRWDFIRVLANQEGGMHVDPTVEADHVQLGMTRSAIAVDHRDCRLAQRSGYSPARPTSYAECALHNPTLSRHPCGRLLMRR